MSPPRYSGHKLKQFLRLGCAALAVALAVGCVPFLRGFARGGELSESFATNCRQDIYLGTHFSISVDDVGDGDGFFLDDEGWAKARISSLNDEIITKLVLTRGFYFANATNATAGTRTIDGDIITFDNINASSVTLYAQGAHVQIRDVVIYYMMPIAVTDITLDSSSLSLVVDGNAATLSATVLPDNATDKTVKWSVTSGDDKIKLFSDASCETEIGSDATDALTVYVKGIADGSATVKVESNDNSGITANCTVTVKPSLTFVPAEDATCTTPGNIAYYEGSDGKFYTDENYTLLTDRNNDGTVDVSDTVIAAPGHDWSEWATVTEPTETTPGEEEHFCHRDGCGERETREIPALGADDYQFTADSLFKWTKGSTDGLTMVIENTSGDDTQTFSKLVSVSVDGTTLTRDTDYTAEPGSIKLTLSPDYLSTLDAGEHTLSVELTVTTLTHTFTVAAPAATDSPASGESLLLISVSLVLMLLAAGGVAYVLIRRRKTAE